MLIMKGFLDAEFIAVESTALRLRLPEFKLQHSSHTYSSIYEHYFPEKITEPLSTLILSSVKWR